MFEARRSTVSRLLDMFATEHVRSQSLATVIGTNLSLEDKDQSSSSVGPLIIKGLMSAGAIAATVATIFHEASPIAPEGFEDESPVVKAKEILKNQFESKEERAADQASVSSTQAPSPLVSGADVDANRIKTAKSSDEIREAIRSAAGQQKVDFSLLYGVAGAESSFRTSASASSSSAVGLFQFTEGTWKFLVNKFKLPYTPADRNDAKKSAQVAGLYIRSINESLQRQLGRVPTYGEVYMGYFLGPSGAARFLDALKANPNAIGAEAFPRAAHANPNVFYNKGSTSQPLTMTQILAKQEGKIASYAKDVDPTYASAGKTTVAATREKTASSPKTIQVALNGPVVSQTASASSQSGRNVAPIQLRAPDVSNPRTRTSGTGNGVVPIQKAMPEVVASSETAPPVKTKQDPTASSSQPKILPTGMDSTQKPQTMIIRGKDNRLYALNT